MLTQETNIVNILKKPGFTIAVTALAGFGIGLLFQRNRNKVQNEVQNLNQSLKKEPSEKFLVKPQANKHGDLPPEYEVSLEELATILQEFKNLFNDKKRFEEIIPRNFSTDQDLRNLCSNLENTQHGYDLIALTEGVSSPIWDMLDREGKGWRAIMNMFVAQAFNKSIDEIIEAANLVEIIHNGFSVIEDIEDKTEIRRGKAAIHLLYGHDISINAGCFLYFVPWFNLFRACEQRFSDDKLIRLMKLYIEEMINIHIGRAWKIHWNGSKKFVHIPTESQYLQMLAHKIGVLPRLGVRLTCEMIGIHGDVQRRCAIFSERVAMAFEIHNDIMSYKAEAAIVSNTFNKQNITRGSITLVVIHCLNNLPHEDKNRLLEILRMKTVNEALVNEVIVLFNKSGSIEYARLKAESLIQEAWEQVKDSIPNNKYKGYLKALAELFATRKI